MTVLEEYRKCGRGGEGNGMGILVYTWRSGGKRRIYISFSSKGCGGQGFRGR